MVKVAVQNDEVVAHAFGGNDDTLCFSQKVAAYGSQKYVISTNLYTTNFLNFGKFI